MEDSAIEDKASSSRPGIRPPLFPAPPFVVPWEFYTTMPSDTPTYDYYSFLALFQYWDGWTEGQFSAGLGDVPLPEDAPVVSWGWRHRLDEFPRGGHFRANYQIGSGEVIFSGDEGYDPGSTVSIWPPFSSSGRATIS